MIGNTTIERPASLKSRFRDETGGLSGKPLFEPSTRLLSHMYRLTGGKLPLVGVGGISSGRDAYEKIRAGASLFQLYTAFVYQGPVLIRRIKGELTALLRRDGLDKVESAVGADHR
jgi:dihydroorotate dehydrogenase